jgi:transcriptional regulator with XRE-family HTH domain
VTLKERIRDLMVAQGIDNYRILSKKSGIPERVLSELWNGEENIDLRSLKTLCIFFSISADYLLFGREATKEDPSPRPYMSLQEEREFLRGELLRMGKRLRELDEELAKG